jgi:hypothetical protein
VKQVAEAALDLSHDGAHQVCDDYHEVATASLIENWI